MQGIARIAYRRNVPLFDAVLDALVGRSEVSASGRKVAGLGERRP